jgi:hypothetical protein
MTDTESIPAPDSRPVVPQTHRLSERQKAHLLAYAFFLIAAVISCLRGVGSAFVPEFFLIAVIAWFPAMVVESFRRLGIEGYGFASAMLCGIAGYDGVFRLFHPGYVGGC